MSKCASCRVRHLDCDQNQSCFECEKAGRQCLRGYNVRFRYSVCPADSCLPSDFSKYEFFYSKDQKWLRTDHPLEYVLEDGLEIENTPMTSLWNKESSTQPESTIPGRSRGDYLGVENSKTLDGLAAESKELESFSLDAMHSRAQKYNISGHSEHRITDWDVQGLHGTRMSFQPDLNLSYTPHADKSYPHLPESQNSGPQRGPAQKMSQWPLKNIREARLLQHFNMHLAPWFDCGDTEQHFGKIAPYIAASSPLLLNALLSISSLHHARVTGSHDFREAISYHDKCLQMIVPMLGNPDRVKDDAVLMTTVILHLYEDHYCNETRVHLEGTSSFYSSTVQQLWSSARQAVWWIHLRQEIFSSFIQQRIIRMNNDVCEPEFPDQSSSDEQWFHYMLYIAARISQYAFGEDSSAGAWRELQRMMSLWEENRPASFDPLFVDDRSPENSKLFPDVCFAKDLSVECAQFFYLSKIMLTTHDPALPRIGPGMKSAVTSMQAKALSYVRTMVGIAVSNTFVPARFDAILAIRICSSWFGDGPEQLKLLAFIRATHQYCGWPNKNIETALKEEWGIDLEDD